MERQSYNFDLFNCLYPNCDPNENNSLVLNVGAYFYYRDLIIMTSYAGQFSGHRLVSTLVNGQARWSILWPRVEPIKLYKTLEHIVITVILLS